MNKIEEISEKLTLSRINPQELYNANQVAELFTVHVNVIYKLIRVGKIATVGGETFGKKLILGQTVLDIAGNGSQVKTETMRQRKKRAARDMAEISKRDGIRIPDAKTKKHAKS